MTRMTSVADSKGAYFFVLKTSFLVYLENMLAILSSSHCLSLGSLCLFGSRNVNFKPNKAFSPTCPSPLQNQRTDKFLDGKEGGESR